MDRNLDDVLREGAIAGSAASLASAAALVILGRRENRAPAAPINAVSHWLWDHKALRADEPSAKYTLNGALIHHGAAMIWGVLHAWAWGSQRGASEPLPALGAAAAATAVAAFVDYRMTPKRLTPGFEHRLSRSSMVLVYAMFAAGLGLGSLAAARARCRAAPAGRS